MEIRKATVDDIDSLISLRLDFMRDEGVEISEEDTKEFIQRLKDYFFKAIKNETFIAFFAENDGKITSTAFMAIADRPPRKPYVSSLYGTIYNVFTYKDFRRKGVATSLLNAILEEAKEIGLGFVDLLATEDGKPLYEQIGFWNINMPYMRKELM